METTVVTKKLSQLIREGAALHPQQAFRCYTAREPDGSRSTCALGAAYEAHFGNLPSKDLIWSGVQLLQSLGIKNVEVAHPMHTSDTWGLASLITDLNDEHRWSRERIADYLEIQGY